MARQGEHLAPHDLLDIVQDFFENQYDPVVLEEYSELILGFIIHFFDTNNDGFISDEEYERMFKIFGMNELQAGLAFHGLDKDGDNRLSRYELLNAVETFLTSDDPANSDNWVFGDPLLEE